MWSFLCSWISQGLSVLESLFAFFSLQRFEVLSALLALTVNSASETQPDYRLIVPFTGYMTRNKTPVLPEFWFQEELLMRSPSNFFTEQTEYAGCSANGDTIAEIRGAPYFLL